MLNQLVVDYVRNKKIIQKLQDKYGLIPAKLIRRDYKDGHLRLFLKDVTDIQLFPHTQICEVVEILSNNNEIWDQSSLNVFALPPIIGRAPIFGVPLRKAFSESLKTGIQKSRFAIYPEEILETKGLQADLLIFVKTSDLGINIREVEIWQDVRGIDEVFYGHLILDIRTEIANHFDCATISISRENKQLMFQHATKVKGSSKQKHFRVDGMLPISIAIDLLRAYFPVEELVNEAVESY